MGAPNPQTTALELPPAPKPYRAEHVATLLGVSPITIYEHARRDPDRWGVIRIGRAVRFRRPVIDRMAGVIDG